MTAFYLRLQVADEAGVLARITGILAEHDISIDALLQRPSGSAAEGAARTDVIILTHDTVEGRMTTAIAQMQALPTVLAPIVRIRKEDLAERPHEVRQHARRRRRARRSARSCSKAWRPDGGLYLPERYPQVDAATLARWRAPAVPGAGVRGAVALHRRHPARRPARARATGPTRAEVFGDARITPLRPLEPGVFVLGLSNGPTLAFKDMAMQLLGNAVRVRAGAPRRARSTSSARPRATPAAPPSTRCAASAASQVFMLSPHGRMSPFQQAQMFSLQDANIHNIAVEGVFDDCQDIVKAVSADLAFKQRHRIGTVNSINWARLLAQVVYYFAGYFQATDERRRAGRASPCRRATSATSAPATSRA